MTDRAAVAAAVRALDLVPVTGVPGAGALAHAFPLPLEAGVIALLALVDVWEPRARTRLAVPLVVADGGWRVAAPGDGAWRALAMAIVEGRSIPALVDEPAPDEVASRPAPVQAVLVCRPAAAPDEALAAAALDDGREEPPGAAAPGATATIGGRLALRVYAPLEPGLEPDLELGAFLAEEARFGGVEPLAGWAEVITRGEGVATVAALRGYDAAARPLDAVLAERLAELALAPGVVSLDWATDVARDLGGLVAAMQAALADPPGDAVDLAPREASRDEIHGWRTAGRRALEGAMTRLRALEPPLARRFGDVAPAVAERVARFEALPTAPLVARVHGRLDLSAILASEDGTARIVGFDGPPGDTVEARRRPDSPLRDVARLLRSIDAVARLAAVEAVRRNGGPLVRSALDPSAWHERARERFRASYADGIRRAGAPFAVDPDLLDAFEVVEAAARIGTAGDAAAGRAALEALEALVR